MLLQKNVIKKQDGNKFHTQINQGVYLIKVLSTLNSNIVSVCYHHLDTNHHKFLLIFDEIRMRTSTNSWVNLKAEVSKPRFLPGELERMKPKSMWMMWPLESSKMLPLCLQTHKGIHVYAIGYSLKSMPQRRSKWMWKQYPSKIHL